MLHHNTPGSRKDIPTPHGRRLRCIHQRQTSSRYGSNLASPSSMRPRAKLFRDLSFDSEDGRTQRARRLPCSSPTRVFRKECQLASQNGLDLCKTPHLSPYRELSSCGAWIFCGESPSPTGQPVRGNTFRNLTLSVSLVHSKRKSCAHGRPTRPSTSRRLPDLVPLKSGFSRRTEANSWTDGPERALQSPPSGARRAVPMSLCLRATGLSAARQD